MKKETDIATNLLGNVQQLLGESLAKVEKTKDKVDCITRNRLWSIEAQVKKIIKKHGENAAVEIEHKQLYSLVSFKEVFGTVG